MIHFINPPDLASKLGGNGFTNSELRKFSQLTEGIKKRGCIPDALSDGSKVVNAGHLLQPQYEGLRRRVNRGTKERWRGSEEKLAPDDELLPHGFFAITSTLVRNVTIKQAEDRKSLDTQSF
ncbi:MAG: hypothetical protein KAS19_07100, partial [Anaerolineales bacterium]|nr:hypothetical protein [Anaerolineales bacterium]